MYNKTIIVTKSILNTCSERGWKSEEELNLKYALMVFNLYTLYHIN